MRVVKQEILEAKVIGYLHEDLSPYCEYTHKDRPCVVICPGGGYVHLSPREADPVAFRFLDSGFNVFILYYAIGDEIRRIKPIRQLSALMEHIRANASNYHINKDQIAVCGFSAGAHLAASLAVFAPHMYPSSAPDAAILGYPVISSDPAIGHMGSFDSLCDNEKEREEYSLEKQVTGQTCPIFIFHSADDASVPVYNSLRFATALSDNKVPYELHIFPSAKHGCSTATYGVGSQYTNIQVWSDLAVRFLKDLFKFEE